MPKPPRAAPRRRAPARPRGRSAAAGGGPAPASASGPCATVRAPTGAGLPPRSRGRHTKSYTDRDHGRAGERPAADDRPKGGGEHWLIANGTPRKESQMSKVKNITGSLAGKVGHCRRCPAATASCRSSIPSGIGSGVGLAGHRPCLLPARVDLAADVCGARRVMPARARPRRRAVAAGLGMSRAPASTASARWRWATTASGSNAYRAADECRLAVRLRGAVRRRAVPVCRPSWPLVLPVNGRDHPACHDRGRLLDHRCLLPGRRLPLCRKRRGDPADPRAAWPSC